VRPNWFVRQEVLGANIHETEGLLELNIALGIGYRLERGSKGNNSGISGNYRCIYVV